MSTSIKNDFITKVTKQVHFPFDRKIIANELEDHLKELETYFIGELHDPTLAKSMAISEMGDPVEIGIELNEVHKPLWGWLWILSKSVCIALACIMIWLLVLKGWATWQDSQVSAVSVETPEIIFESLNLDTYAIDIIADYSPQMRISLNHDTLIFDRFLLNRNGTLIILYQDIKQFNPFNQGSNHYPIRELSNLILPDGQRILFQKVGVKSFDRCHVLIAIGVPANITSFDLEFNGYSNHFKTRFSWGN